MKKFAEGLRNPTSLTEIRPGGSSNQVTYGAPASSTYANFVESGHQERSVRRAGRDSAATQVSPIMRSKASTNCLKKSEMKQLSTASDSMFVYDISQPKSGKQQPLTVKNQSSFSTKAASTKGLNGGSAHATNIRVKTPNETTMMSMNAAANQTSGSGNRANLFNKYLRATDISNQKRGTSVTKRVDVVSTSKQAVKRQHTKTGDSFRSVRNSSLASQRQHQP